MQRNTVAGERLGQNGDKLEMRLARRGGFGIEALRQLWDGMRKNGDPSSLLKVNGMNIIDDLKVEIRYRGRTQVFSLLNPDDSPIRMDITNQVRFGHGNIPTWESIHAAADNAWEDISAIINGGA